MTTRAKLTRTLQSVAGLPRDLIERTASNLTAAGLLPPAGRDLLPEDAVTLLVALTASPSPDDAVVVVNAYRSAALVGAVYVDGTEFAPLAAGADMSPELQEGVISAAGMLIGSAHKGRPGKSLRLDLHKSAEWPSATVYIIEEGRGTLQLQFGAFIPIDRCTPIPVVVIPPGLIAAVASLFDVSLSIETAHPISAVLH